MYTISISKECGCFRRSPYENNLEFSSKDDALLQANLMQNHMNSKFCGTHHFELKEEGEKLLIEVSMNESTKSGCCGGGHCS